MPPSNVSHVTYGTKGIVGNVGCGVGAGHGASGEVVVASDSQSVLPSPASSEAEMVDDSAIRKESCLSGSSDADSFVSALSLKKESVPIRLVNHEACTHFDYYGSYYLNFKMLTACVIVLNVLGFFRDCGRCPRYWMLSVKKHIVPPSLRVRLGSCPLVLSALCRPARQGLLVV